MRPAESGGDLLLQQLAALGPIGVALVPQRIFPSALGLHRRGDDTVLILPQYRCRGEVKRQDSVSSLRRTPFAVQALAPSLALFFYFSAFIPLLFPVVSRLRGRCERTRRRPVGPCVPTYVCVCLPGHLAPAWEAPAAIMGRMGA